MFLVQPFCLLNHQNKNSITLPAKYHPPHLMPIISVKMGHNRRIIPYHISVDFYSSLVTFHCTCKKMQVGKVSPPVHALHFTITLYTHTLYPNLHQFLPSLQTLDLPFPNHTNYIHEDTTHLREFKRGHQYLHRSHQPTKTFIYDYGQQDYFIYRSQIWANHSRNYRWYCKRTQSNVSPQQNCVISCTKK